MGSSPVFGRFVIVRSKQSWNNKNFQKPPPVRQTGCLIVGHFNNKKPLSSNEIQFRTRTRPDSPCSSEAQKIVVFSEPGVSPVALGTYIYLAPPKPTQVSNRETGGITAWQEAP